MIHQIAATLLLMIVFGTLYGALRDRYPKYLKRQQPVWRSGIVEAVWQRENRDFQTG